MSTTFVVFLAIILPALQYFPTQCNPYSGSGRSPKNLDWMEKIKEYSI